MSTARHLAHITALLSALLAQAPAFAATDSAEQIVQRAIVMNSTNRIIVKLRPVSNGVARPMSGEHMNTFMTRAGQPLRWLRRTGKDAHVLQLDGSLPLSDAKALAQKLAEDPAIEYVQPDRRMYAFATPGDPLFAQQWYLSDNIVGLNVDAAWDSVTGVNVNPGIVVAVLDTGIFTHRDLPSARVLAGYDFISNALVAGDGGGRDSIPSDAGDRVTSADRFSLEGVFSSACDVEDSSWHGLRVASVIGANTNNAIDIAGVNWNVRLLPMRVLGRCGGFTTDILDAMRWAAGLAVSGVPLNSTPAQVLNLSLGVFDDEIGFNQTACDRAEQDVVTEILTQSGVKAIVVAAGNESDEARKSTPASCIGVVSVGGVLRSGSKATASNFGPYVTVSAPYGVAEQEGSPCQSFSADTILSLSNSGTDGPTTGGDRLCDNGGTSFSAPLVSGVISLMLSANPDLVPSQVYDILRQSARTFPPGSNCLLQTVGCGSGTVNAQTAVSVALNNPPAVRSFPDPNDIGGGAGGSGGGCTLAPRGNDASVALLLLGICCAEALRRVRRINARHGRRTWPARKA